MIDLRTGVLRALKVREALEEASGATAIQQLRAHGAQSLKRIAAEDKIAIEQLGGTMEKGEAADMGDVIIGDHIHAAKEPSAFGQLAGKALLAAAIATPLAAVAWKALDRPTATPVPAVQTFEPAAYTPSPQPIIASPTQDRDTVTELKIFRGN